MAERRRPDAIVTCNDNIAVGVYRALHQLGLAIPDDVAVASFNDISVAQFLSPPLTTVHLPAEEIGETAVELLLERVSGRDLTKFWQDFVEGTGVLDYRIARVGAEDVTQGGWMEKDGKIKINKKEMDRLAPGGRNNPFAPGV